MDAARAATPYRVRICTRCPPSSAKLSPQLAGIKVPDGRTIGQIPAHEFSPLSPRRALLRTSCSAAKPLPIAPLWNTRGVKAL